jgi:hypothetical protein
MTKLLPISLMMTAGLVIAVPFLSMQPISAHQTQADPDSNVIVMIHLDPQDSPYAGKSTLTWFMLTRSNGEMIAPTTCNCQVKVYNGKNVEIANHLPLSLMSVEGHEVGHKAFRTQITFPKPGTYTVVVLGTAKDKSFSAFERKFSVTVRP